MFRIEARVNGDFLEMYGTDDMTFEQAVKWVAEMNTNPISQRIGIQYRLSLWSNEHQAWREQQ
jgi:hypothetical protein